MRKNMTQYTLGLLPLNKAAAGFVAAIGVGLTKLVLAISYAGILDSYMSTQQQKLNNYLFFCVSGLTVYIICYYSFIYGRQCIQLSIAKQIQDDLLHTKAKMDYRSAERQDNGEWTTLLLSDAEAVANHIPNTILQLTQGIVGFITALIYGMYASPLLTCIILVTSLFSLGLPKLLNKGVEKSQEVVQKEEAKLRGLILSTFDNIPLIKNYSAGERIKSYFSNRCAVLARARINRTQKLARLTSLSYGIGFLANASWMIVAIFFIQQNKISIGTFVGFMTLSDAFNWPFFSLSYYLGELATQKASYVRIQAFLSSEIDCCKSSYDVEKRSLTVSQVSFSYGDADEVLSQIDFSILPGQKVGLIGGNGAGKSTLLKLLMGLYRPKSGLIEFGMDGQSLSFNTHPEYFSYVPQGNNLFTATIRENILLGNADASNDELIWAAKLADAHEFISALQKGYDTWIGKGGEITLSYGQEQRIAFARALLKKRSLLVLDEFTSALDDDCELRVVNALNSDTKRTIIMVSHKRKPLTICDSIVNLTKL